MLVLMSRLTLEKKENKRVERYQYTLSSSVFIGFLHLESSLPCVPMPTAWEGVTLYAE